MNIPSYAEAVAIARKINVSGIMGRDGLADFGIKFMREAQEREMSTDDKLRRALEPFACVAVEWDGEPESLEVELRAYDNRMCPGIPVAAFRAAREALAATQEPFNLEKRPVAFRYKNGVDEWELTDDEAVADAAVNAGHDAQGLYVRAATQEPAHFSGEQALAEWEGKHGGGK